MGVAMNHATPMLLSGVQQRRAVHAATAVGLAAITAHEHSHRLLRAHAHLILCCLVAQHLAQITLQSILAEFLFSDAHHTLTELLVLRQRLLQLRMLQLGRCQRRAAKRAMKVAEDNSRARPPSSQLLRQAWHTELVAALKQEELALLQAHRALTRLLRHICRYLLG